MADLRLVAVQTRFQLTALARNRRALTFGMVSPVVLLVTFNSVFVTGNDTVTIAGATVTAHAHFTQPCSPTRSSAPRSASSRSGSWASARAASSSA